MDPQLKSHCRALLTDWFLNREVNDIQPEEDGMVEVVDEENFEEHDEVVDSMHLLLSLPENLIQTLLRNTIIRVLPELRILKDDRCFFDSRQVRAAVEDELHLDFDHPNFTARFNIFEMIREVLSQTTTIRIIHQ